MSNDNVSARLDQIQAQLAKLQQSYGDIVRTYYNIFYNPEAMDVHITLYDNNGELKEITVPNRAKDSMNNMHRCSGDPNGVVSAPAGSLCFDEVNFKLYYKTTTTGAQNEGWVKILSTSDFVANKDYLPYINGDGKNLGGINAYKIESGELPVVRGGTGVSELTGILKGIPPVKDTAGNVITPGYVTTAEAGVDYTSLSTFNGIICFSPTKDVPEGFLACDGAAYRVDLYRPLYDFLRRRIRPNGRIDYLKFPYEDGDESLPEDLCTDKTKSFYVVNWDPYTQEANVKYFRVPNLMGYFPRFWSPDPMNTVDSEPDRAILSTQLDRIPNIQGMWAQEITGIAENYFNGAVYLPKEDDKPIQVAGKTSAPGGYYDYLIGFNAANCSEVYDDNATEITVKNVALLPIIKYSITDVSSVEETTEG